VSATKPAAPEPSEIAGRYLIEKKLGAGAFGTVYKAKDKELGRMVAIKTIRLEGLAASTASLEDLLKRFRQEAQVAARLRHPNIVMLYDIGTSEGLSYISMEFVDGVGLDRVIAKSGKMAVERAAAIGAQVADALAAAHKHGIVHRDIKPANIMIEPGDQVKVADFGIAKLTDSTAEHLTATGSLLGTPSYMSPEQARGGKIDGRSDLFSVGCILYEMLAGQKAFRGDSLTAVLFKIITEEPPSLRELDPTVSDEMLRIIAKALSKAPETRYQSGRELADDLLAVTRPGFVPTLRAAETPTLPPDTPPGDVPTIASAPTIESAPTAPGLAPTKLVPPPVVPPPLPTVVSAPPSVSSVPPVPGRPPVSARPPAAAARPARRSGISPLVLLGVAAVGLAFVGVAGWLLLGRLRAPAAAPEASPTPAAEAAQSPIAPASTPSPLAASGEAAPAVQPEQTPTPLAAAPAAGRTASPGSHPASAATRPTPPPQTAAAQPPPNVAEGTAAAGGAYGYLDEPPADTADGRAAGEALAQKYRAGGGSSYSGTRYAQRQRVPRGISGPERPAVATLLYLHSAEEAFHRANARYGTLAELKTAGLLMLDVPFDASGFRRARYGFRMTVSADGYRAEARPMGPVGRLFFVDDSGFVQLEE
jgi:serine/threonine protein kinase